MNRAKEIVQNMFNNDAYSKWLGIEVLETGSGISKLKMKVS